MKYDDPSLLYLMGDLMARTGRQGVAIQLFSACLQLNPKFQEALIDLGVAFKSNHHNSMAEASWQKALEVGPPNYEIFVNLATLYADTCEPEKALEYLDKASAIQPEDFRGGWNRCLASLTMGRWEEGWKLHEYRRQLENWHPRTKHKLDEWDGSFGKHVLVHGEQGLGDEIMFLSCLPDIIARSKRVTVECEPRLIPLVERSFGIKAFADEKSTPPLGYDCQVPLGTLPMHFRNTPESFPGKPYLKADPQKVRFYREKLAALGPPPYIALGWYGGVNATRPHERSVPAMAFTPIRAGWTCVSAQYGPFAQSDADDVGLPVVEESHGLDLDAQVALVAACDLVVTVPQTLVHIAGSLGVPTIVLTPAACSWRYGKERDTMPWYNSVRLIRQTERGKWQPIIDAAADEIERRYGEPLEASCESTS